MPLYEYLCSACGRLTEAIQSHSDPPLTVCESCGGALKKQLSSPAVQFKGSGWYVSDYGKGSSGPRESGKEGKGDKEGDAKAAPAPDAPASEAPKPASSPDAAPSKDGGKSSG
jgi:putative FmdB family regulatory protein